MELKTNEQWRPIEGFPCYLVSDQGRIKSIRNPKNPKILKPGHNWQGYESVTLMSGNEHAAAGTTRCCRRVHKLVAEAFIPNPEKKPYIDHINTITNDNRAENLRWVTGYENYHNPLTMEHMEAAKPARVEKTKHKVYVYDEQLNLVYTFPSTADAARILQRNQGNIASCCTGALPRYLGWIWSYEELTDISQRKELEEKMRYQFEKNRKSTYKASSRYFKAKYAAGEGWYHKHREEGKAAFRKYYYEHREEILAKQKAKRKKKREDEERKNGIS